MPPQPNCPPAPVPDFTLVSGTKRSDWCYTFASDTPEKVSAWLPVTLCISRHTASTRCSKTPRGLLSPMEDAGLFVQLMWLHRVVGGDSGALVVPFMHVGTYPTRHLAHFCYLSDLKTIEASLLFVANFPASLQGSDSILIVLQRFLA